MTTETLREIADTESHATMIEQGHQQSQMDHVSTSHMRNDTEEAEAEYEVTLEEGISVIEPAEIDTVSDVEVEMDHAVTMIQAHVRQVQNAIAEMEAALNGSSYLRVRTDNAQAYEFQTSRSAYPPSNTPDVSSVLPHSSSVTTTTPSIQHTEYEYPNANANNQVSRNVLDEIVNNQRLFQTSEHSSSWSSDQIEPNGRHLSTDGTITSNADRVLMNPAWRSVEINRRAGLHQQFQGMAARLTDNHRMHNATRTTADRNEASTLSETVTRRRAALEDMMTHEDDFWKRIAELHGTQELLANGMDADDEVLIKSTESLDMNGVEFMYPVSVSLVGR